MADTKEMKAVLFGPVFANNPIALQVLGICSALAVTSSLKNALIMSIALTLVTAFSSLFISSIRKYRSDLYIGILCGPLFLSY